MINLKDKVFDTNKLTEIKTPISRGVKGIEVDLVQCIENPYKNMVNMALATWGSKLEKWSMITPEERFGVVKQVMNRKALPLGKESPIFLFGITGVTRSSFDQIARQRVGSTFSSLGWNNVHLENGFRVSNEILDNNYGETYYFKIIDLVDKIKVLYSDMIKDGISWQSAREVLPLGMLHWFHFSITFEALLAFCSRRCCFSEKEDTVAVAWLMRQRVKEKFPYLASYLRPACDNAGRCLYHTDNSLPEEMGTLFSCCGRNLVKMVNEPNIDWDRPSTNILDLERDLDIIIPRSNEDKPVESYEELKIEDKVLLNAN